jgi:hypothetical protein
MNLGMLGRLYAIWKAGETAGQPVPIAIYVKGMVGVVGGGAAAMDAMPTRLPGILQEVVIPEGLVRFTISGVSNSVFPGLNNRRLTVSADEIVGFDQA